MHRPQGVRRPAPADAANRFDRLMHGETGAGRDTEQIDNVGDLGDQRLGGDAARRRRRHTCTPTATRRRAVPAQMPTTAAHDRRHSETRRYGRPTGDRRRGRQASPRDRGPTE